MTTGYPTIQFSVPFSPVPIGGGSLLPVQRNLIMQSATMQTFITIPETTATGDFEFSINVNTVSTAQQVLLGRSDAVTDWLAIQANGAIAFNLLGITAQSAASVFDYGRNNVINVSRTNGAVSVRYNGTVVATSNPPLSDLTINNIARFQSGLYTDGFLWDLDFVSGFSINATYPLDETLVQSNVIRNSVATLGSELVTNGGFDDSSNWNIGTGWTISGGSMSAASATGVNITTQGAFANTAGNTYMIDVSISAVSSGGVRFNIGGVFSEAINTAGQHTLTVTSANSSQTLGIWPAGTATLNIESISVREAPGYGTASASLSAQFSESYQVIDVGFLQVANSALITSTPVLGDDGNSLELSDNVVTVSTGEEWRIAARISQVIGVPIGNAGWTSSRGAPSSPPFRLTGASLSVGAVVSGDFNVTGSGSQVLFGRDTAQVAYDQISAHRLLRNA